jgi:hypothetical protein
MTTINERKEDEDEQEKTELSIDILGTAAAIPAGIGIGFIASHIFPPFIPDTIEYIREKKINNLGWYSLTTSALYGYSLGIYKIINDIAQDPRDVTNYWPLATNAIGGAIDFGYRLYQRGIEKGKEEITK